MADERESYLQWRETPDAEVATPAQAPAQAPAQVAGPEAYTTWRNQQQTLATDRASLLIEQAVPQADAVAAMTRATLANEQGMALTPDVLTDATSELSRRIETQTRRAQLAGSTRLSGWIARDPMNAALAQAELQNLSATEGLIQSGAKGFDQAATGWWNRRRVRGAEDDLASLQTRREDRDRSLGSIIDDVKSEMDLDDFDQNVGYTITKTYAQSLGRYLSSRVTFGSDERLDEFEQTLVTALDDALYRAATNTERVQQSYGSSQRVARVDALVADISSTGTPWEQVAAFGDLVRAEPRAFTEWMANVVVESAPSFVAGAAATAVTRRPSVGAAVMGVMSGNLGEAMTFDTLVRDAGYDLTDPEQRAALVNDPKFRAQLRDRSFAYGTVVGLMDAASGGVASRTLVKNPAGEMVLQAMAQALMGGSGEALGMLASGQDINMVDVLVEGLAEFATAPIEVAGVGGRYLRDRRLVEQDRRFFNALGQSAEESTLRAQVPERYRSALEAMTKDGPVETLYVDAQALEQLFQSDPNGTTAEQFLGAVPNVDVETYRQALDNGGTVEIPTASYASDIVGTRFDDMIRDHLRTDPERMSAAELRAYNEQVKELATTTQEAVDRAESGQTELERVAESARVELVSALRRAGRTADVAELEALKSVAFARATAQRMGIPLEDFMARYPLPDVQGVLESTTAGAVPRVTVEMVERARAPETDDADAEWVATMRDAADAVNLDLATAEPIDVERALERMYGPAAGPTLLAQVAQRNQRAATPSDITGGITTDFLRRGGWGVVTAARGVEADAAQNAALEQELQQRGIEYVRMEGVYRGVSDGTSFMIFADEATVRELGAKYGQESVLTREGLVFMDGSPTVPLAPDDLVTGDAAKDRDFYSVMDDGSTWSAGFAQELFQPRDDVRSGGMAGDGRHFTNFFADVTSGVRQQPQRLDAYEPVVDLPDAVKAFAREREPFSGNFEDHIQTSIPSYREMQDGVGYAIAETLGDGAILDIGASEGAMAKAVVQRNEGATAIALDPNLSMRDTFEAKPQVEGARFDLSAFGTAEDAGQVAWTEDDGTEIPYFDPKGQKFDIVHEAMVFQFVSNRRGAQVRRAKELMTDDGLFLTFEKFGGPADEYLANEYKKDQYKSQYYDQETLAAKAAEVLQTGGDAVEGMTDLQVSVAEMEQVLLDNFKFVTQIWDSGNFKGFAASDSYYSVSRFVSKLPPLDSEYTTTPTPRRVYTAREDTTTVPIPVNEDGTVTLTHWSDEARDTIDPARAGTGPLNGAERNTRGPNKSFYGVNVGQAGGYRKENLGAYRHEARVDATTLYDLSRDPQGIVDAIPSDLPTPQRVGWVEEQIKEKGFKGYVVMDGPTGAVAALFEAVAPERVADDRTLEFYQSGATPDFFSALTREVENAKQKKAGAREWFSIIQKLPGVKKAEIEWSGVEAWLFAQEGQIAREDVAAFLRDNEVEVETVIRSGDAEDEYGDGEMGITGYEVNVDSRGEIVEKDEDYLRETGWEQNGDYLIERELERDGYDEGADESDISEKRMDELRDEAYQMASDQYYEDPHYIYDVEIILPDGVTHNETIVEYSYGGVLWDGDAYATSDDARMAIVERYADDAYNSSGESEGGGTKWGEYTETGGENYREVLLTVPDLDSTGPNEGLSVDAFVNDSHFPDPNIVVHARLNERLAANGDKVLFVEEVQSDLGSHWREQGGTPSARDLAAARAAANAARAARAASNRAYAAFSGLYAITPPPATVTNGTLSVHGLRMMDAVIANDLDKAVSDAGFSTLYSDDEQKAVLNFVRRAVADNPEGAADVAEAWAEYTRLDAVAIPVDNAVKVSEPITPFEGEAYYALMMKKLLKMAAEEGADRLAWTPAYMQARRWSGAVQNVVQEITWETAPEREATPMIDMATGATAQVGQRVVTLDGTNGADAFVLDADGTIIGKEGHGGRIPENEVVGKNISELIGGVMAKRVMGEEAGSIAGENIVIGGDGYKISYDQQIKKFVEKFAKKYGGKLTVDKTMPDFVKGTNSDPLARIVKRYGYQNIMRDLRTSDLRSAQFWAGFDKEVATLIQERLERNEASIEDNEAELARLKAEMDAMVGNGASAGDDNYELLANKHARLSEMTKDRRDLMAAQLEPENVAAGEYKLLIQRAYLDEDDVKTLLPEDQLPQGDAVWSVTITDKMREAAMQAQPLFQRRPDGARGSILLPTEQGRAPVISLFEGADLSTFLHESAHYYLHILQDIAARGEQTEGMTADWETIKKWWMSNIDGVAEDGGVTQAQVRAYLKRGTTGDLDIDRKVNVGLQEQWARAFEAYLMEGKAPSNALRAAFESFSAWLLSVYKRATGLNVEISDELRGVFDRLLATDAEIADAAQENGFDKLVAASAAELGVTEEEYQKLVKLSVEAQDEAKQNTLAAVMAPIRRARTAEYRAERKIVEADIRGKVNAKPANRVREWLGNGRWLGDDAPEELPSDLRLDRDMLIDDYGQDKFDALPRGRQPIWLAGSGVAADDVAGWFGYKSGSEMLDDLITMPRAEDEIKTRTDAEMRKRYGDPLSDGSIEQEAVRALHGEKRGQLIAAELRAIGKVAKRGQITTRGQAAEIARRTIRQMPIRKAVRSGQYLAAERRAGERAAMAMARGNKDEAYAAKREQLLNYQLYMESKRADEMLSKVESRVAKLKKKSVRENLAGEYLGAIDDILTSYDFRKSVTQRAAKRRAGLQEYVEMMIAAGRENELAIPSYVLDEAKRRPYKTLPVAELEGVLDSLRNIEHTARMKQKLRDAQAERDLTVVVDSVTGEMDANIENVTPNRVATPGEKRRKGAREFANLLLNAETLLRKIGGFDRGTAYDAIKAPIDAAADQSSIMRTEAAEALENLYSVYDQKTQRSMAVRKHYKELGGSFTKWDLISAALNMGNSDNLARLMDKDSNGFNAAQVEFIKSQLDKRDWDFVQGSWDYIGSFWGQIEKRERRLTGVTPKRVEASEVETPYGTYAGGYYPIKYRSDVSSIGKDDELVEVQNAMQVGRFSKAQTRNGHLEERARGSGGRILQLGIEVMHQHIGQVIHDLAYSEAVVNTSRILKDPRVKAAFERKGLLADHETLELWLLDTATGSVMTGGVISRLASRARTNFTLSRLAFNMSTVAIQLTGITQSMVVVGKKDMARGYLTYMSNIPARSREVIEFSEAMRQRRDTLNRDINDALRDVNRDPRASVYNGVRDVMARWGTWPMRMVQFYGVDIPTWYGAYEGGLRKYGNDEAKARAYADDLVNRAQGGINFSDRSAFERGTRSTDVRQDGFTKLFGLLGSYMFAKGNIAYEVAARTKRDMTGANVQTFNAAVSGAVDLLLLFTVEAIFYNLIKGTLPNMGDDDDDESWAAFLAKETAASMLGTIPYVRDLASGVSGFDVGPYSSIGEALVVKPVTQLAQGEADMALFKAMSNLVGGVTGLPSGQLNRVADAWYRLEEGDDVAPIEFIMGRR